MQAPSPLKAKSADENAGSTKPLKTNNESIIIIE